MKHDLLHIQGKPYVLLPLHEYRMLSNAQDTKDEERSVPEDVLDDLYAGQDSPVKVLRQYRGMTQKALADAAGLSRPYLTEIETGKKDGSVNAIKSIAKALNIAVGLLLV